LVMSSDWPQIRLGDHCIKIGSGATPRGGKEAYLDSGEFRLIRSQNIYNEGFSQSGLAYIDENQAKKLDSVTVEENDVLLNITGDSVARVCLAPRQFLPARVNQHVAIVRPNSRFFDARFVRYFLASKEQQSFMLGLAAAGATRNALTKGMIESFLIPAPEVRIQKLIADVLSSLDDRIALLRETNKTLEAIAQAIFKSWFIDFDPVRAKMEGRAPAGMDEETAELFPDELVESELGLIPKGWIIGDVNHFATFQNGYAFKSKDWSIMGFPAVKIGNVKPTFIDFSDCSMVSQETVNGLDRYKLERGDLLVGMTGYVGEVGLVTGIKKMPYLNQRVGKINPKHGFTRLPYVFCLCRHSGFKVYAESQSHGSAQANVSGIDLMKYKAIIPNELLLQKFNSTLINLIEKLLANQEETHTLKALRDTLLPRLISGKLKVTAFSI